VGNVVFTNTVISLAVADANFCHPVTAGILDSVLMPTALNGGLQCQVLTIILRSQG
jgi:hypothetical protein